MLTVYVVTNVTKMGRDYSVEKSCSLQFRFSRSQSVSVNGSQDGALSDDSNFLRTLYSRRLKWRPIYSLYKVQTYNSLLGFFIFNDLKQIIFLSFSLSSGVNGPLN